MINRPNPFSVFQAWETLDILNTVWANSSPSVNWPSQFFNTRLDEPPHLNCVTAVIATLEMAAFQPLVEGGPPEDNDTYRKLAVWDPADPWSALKVERSVGPGPRCYVQQLWTGGPSVPNAKGHLSMGIVGRDADYLYDLSASFGRVRVKRIASAARAPELGDDEPELTRDRTAIRIAWLW